MLLNMLHFSSRWNNLIWISSINYYIKRNIILTLTYSPTTHREHTMSSDRSWGSVLGRINKLSHNGLDRGMQTVLMSLKLCQNRSVKFSYKITFFKNLINHSFEECARIKRAWWKLLDVWGKGRSSVRGKHSCEYGSWHVLGAAFSLIWLEQNADKGLMGGDIRERGRLPCEEIFLQNSMKEGE